jgi:hypothetical protein
MQKNQLLIDEESWPSRPADFPPIMTPIEAAQFLRLDLTGHTPKSAKRTLNYWRDQGDLRGTKYARHVWYLRNELEEFLKRKTLE